jgi:predicted site-specific integrase-resolvase
MTDRRYLTTAELAKALSINPGTIQRWRRKGFIKPALVTPGQRARWDEASVRAQLQALDEQHRAELEAQERAEFDRTQQTDDEE